MKVELIRAWPRRFDRVELDLPQGTTIADAVSHAGWQGDPEIVAYAIFGQRVEADTLLRDGDRVELLRALEADPKLARRRRADEQRKPPVK